MTTSANIGVFEQLHIEELTYYYKNARQGNVDLIAESMQTNGVYKPLVVNRGTHTGRRNEVLCGNHSLKAMRRLARQYPDDERWKIADVYIVDVDEDAATRLVIVDNRSSDESSYDVEALLSLVDDLPDLAGTGFTQDEVNNILDAFNDVPEDEPADDASRESFGLIVDCDDAADHAALKAELLSRGFTVGDA